MTRIALLLCTAVLLAFGVGIFTSMEATPNPAQNPSQYCDANGDFFLSHGTCVNCAQTANIGACTCNAIRDTIGFPVPDGGFQTHGECSVFFNR